VFRVRLRGFGDRRMEWRCRLRLMKARRDYMKDD
jgi:hypothetical protein